MTTAIWFNSARASWYTTAAWSDHAIPGAGDTAVVTGNGDTAPAENADGLFVASGTDSVIDLSAVFLVPTTVYVPEDYGYFQYTVDTPPVADVAKGVTVAGRLDLIGGTGATGLNFQNSTLAASSVTTVDGVSAWTMSYNDLLAGRIVIGGPIVLNGRPVPSAPVDKHGLVNEIDMNVLGDGSYTGASLNGYVPTVTNAGVIAIEGRSGLGIELAGNPFGAVEIPGFHIAVAPSRSAFINDGTVAVGAGGALEVLSADSIWGAPYSTFSNNGLISLFGAGGTTTYASIEGVLNGTGRIIVDGGAQTDPTKTKIEFNSTVSGQQIFAANATVAFDIDTSLGAIDQGRQFSASTFTFANGNDVLAIQPPAGAYTLAGVSTSLVGVFDIPLFRFGVGDALAFTVDPADVSVTGATFSPVWDARSSTLNVVETYREIFGPAHQFTAAQFKLDGGGYAAGSFAVRSAWNGSVVSPFAVEVTVASGHSVGNSGALAAITPGSVDQALTGAVWSAWT